MDRSSADAFVYAKASGMLAKSFVGSRATRLFDAASLQELWTLVFQTEVPVMPEVMLAKKIEQEAERNFLQDYISLLQNYSHPDAILVDILRFYDFDNLKDIAASLSVAKTSGRAAEIPDIADIGCYSMLNYRKWPDIAGITAGSPVSWYNTVPEFSRQQELDSQLDMQYIRTLWHSMKRLPSVSRSVVEYLIREELVMYNIIWALRLRIYYGMDKESVLPLLATVQNWKTEREIKNDPLAGPAVKTFAFAVDTYTDWEHWKYAEYLNPHEEGVVWEVDPRWVQQAAKTALNKKALQEFHRHPFTAGVLLTWFKIKQYELDCIRTAAEGLRLAVTPDQARDFAGIPVEHR